jgi:hypothetical protein
MQFYCILKQHEQIHIFYHLAAAHQKLIIQPSVKNAFRVYIKLVDIGKVTLRR